MSSAFDSLPPPLKDRQALLAWFRHARRDLPWRATRTPWAVWVSEIMLQQTRVAVVVPYFHRFIERFPDISSLAEADEEDLLAHWSGLGYYRRARNLHRGALHVVEKHAGYFPETWKEARAVPGIGDYTAAAILSICFSKPHAVVDGNVVRVVCRRFGLRQDPTRGAGKKAVQRAADFLLEERQPGRWNEALMELGALVCTRQPSCLLCPWRGNCVASLTGTVAELPALPRPRASVELLWIAALVEVDGKLLMGKRPEGGWMPGLWEFPSMEAPDPDVGAFRRLFRERLGCGFSSFQGDALDCHHSITHHKIRVRARRCSLSGRPETRHYTELMWARRSGLSRLALTGISRKLLKALASGAGRCGVS